MEEDFVEELEYGPLPGYPTFEQVGVMTVTMVGYFTGEITSVYDLFYLLPITRVPIVTPVRPVKKITIPHPGYAGLLLAARYKDEFRGIVKSIPKGTWDHSIIIDFSIAQKNINGKISRTNIQMCGCKSEEMGEESTRLLVSEINQIQEGLDLIQEHIDIYEKVSREVLSDGAGNLVRSLSLERDSESPRPEEEVFELSYDYLKIRSREEQTNVESKIRLFLFRQLSDLKTLSQAASKLTWIPSVKNVINEPLEYSHARLGMRKYHFSLGFRVNQQRLYELFNQVDPEFYVMYHSDVVKNVKIEIPCKAHQGMTGDGVLKHSFSVQQTGQTTYISKISEEMEEFYYRFILAIDLLKDYIMLDSTE